MMWEYPGFQSVMGQVCFPEVKEDIARSHAKSLSKALLENVKRTCKDYGDNGPDLLDAVFKETMLLLCDGFIDAKQTFQEENAVDEDNTDTESDEGESDSDNE
jgi:hypothetical protein